MEIGNDRQYKIRVSDNGPFGALSRDFDSQKIDMFPQTRLTEKHKK